MTTIIRLPPDPPKGQFDNVILQGDVNETLIFIYDGLFAHNMIECEGEIINIKGEIVYYKHHVHRILIVRLLQHVSFRWYQPDWKDTEVPMLAT